MAIYHVLGDALVTEGELREKQALHGFNGTADMEFRHGMFSAAAAPSTFRAADGQVIPFEEIGIGRPLIVELRRLYTGDHPKTGWFDDARDMLVTTAMKSIAALNAAPRAVNLLKKNVKEKTGLSQVAATGDGTPLVFYSPALTEYNSVLTIEFGFDEFDDRFMKAMQKGFSSAAGIPLFATARVYLLAAGGVTKLASGLASALVNRSPVFEATEAIEFLRGGATAARPGFKLVTGDELDRRTLDEFRVDETGSLVKIANGREYKGSVPYVVISYDGRKMDAYQSFTPAAASAALLDRFYSIRENQNQELSLLMESLKLYNDRKFRRRAEEIKAEMGTLEAGSTEFKRKKQEYDAAVANIVDTLLKPKA